jgi:hypothetical protein
MFGFSFGKLLLLALLIFIVWTAFKYMRRVEAIRRVLRDEMQRRQATRRPPPLPSEDLVSCPACGAYVAARSASNCGRGDCPWCR